MKPLRLLPVLLASTLAIPASLRADDPLANQFKAFDKDGDGRVSMAELEEKPMLKKLDQDGDGFVTLEETRSGMARLRGAVANRIKNGKDEQGTVPLEVLFGQVDANDDGKINKEELPNPEWFNKLDGNKDGIVVLDEARTVLGSQVSRKYLPRPENSAPIAKPDEKSLKEQPQQLKGSDHGIGHLVADITLKDLSGKDVTLSQLKAKNGLIIALFSATCPISNKLGAEYARLAKECSERDIAFVLLNAVPSDKTEDLQKFTKDHQITAAVLNDPQSTLLRTLSATTTTEVFLIDAARTLKYRGAVHDQYGLGYSKDAPTKEYLRMAMNDLVKGQPISIAATTAPGCALDLPANDKLATANTNVTYHNQVSRILQNHCVECHRADGVGPFPLETLADVIDNAGMIRKQVERGTMPPWFAAKSDASNESPWANDCSLSTRDKTDLLSWLTSSDRPAGDPKEAPLPRQFSGEWTIGKPDVVFALPKPFAIKAEGTMPYQKATITTSFPEDRWVQAYEIIPTAPQVVHHVIVRVHEKGSKISDRDEGSDGYWAAYVPGNTHRILPPAHAKRLPAGSTISFQIHYTPNGTTVEDQLKIGMIFSKEPPEYEVKVAAVSHPRIRIPAGASDHVEVRNQGVPTDMLFSAYMAHMHVRGKAFKYEVTYPDGKTETLLDIPRYDFNWQLAYDYKQPKFVPRGSVVKITAVYDNSTNNPANPDPTKEVRWGAQTYDEMMIGYVEHFVPLPKAKVAVK
ncbi:EF hand domain-containing protein [Roseimicrobium gellanilyticum]|uniref:EF hand domain-containing protein n=1 Tax=Roseimicrobium gellanilyticum TaxID=748857 RepID=A0A366HDA8_9BACT|nr:redoxin domain-containing protein [Roseimicrobium gellanilyticum]RBP40441.1 EF hand domain-containing protein [Roseimicrobium gellanilyticum]